MPKIKLTIELVPRSVAFSNVRTLLPAKIWNRLRKESYAYANNVCEICGGDGKNQGFRHSLECHEIWEYIDDKNIQRLNGLISLCPNCHMVKHFGRSTAIKKQHIVMKQLENVNGWTHKQAVTYLAEIYRIQKLRSKKKWKLDIQILNEVYEVEKEMITEALKKR